MCEEEEDPWEKKKGKTKVEIFEEQKKKIKEEEDD